MILEQQVTNLELSKRLKELGVKQQGLFFHIENEGIYFHSHIDETQIMQKGYSGFTVSELGEFLKTDQLMPMTVSKKHFSTDRWWRKSTLVIRKLKDGKWNVQYINEDSGVKMRGSTDEKLVDAMAQMLIYLIENNLINPTE